MIEEQAHSDSAFSQALITELGDPAVLGPRIDATVAAAVDSYTSELSSGGGELKVTVLVSWDQHHCAGGEEGASPSPPASTVACHVAPLPPPAPRPVRVEVRGEPRANAGAKDSSWVAERAPLEALMRAAGEDSAGCGAVNELLLSSADGELFEGSQTNFFAVRRRPSPPTPASPAPGGAVGGGGKAAEAVRARDCYVQTAGDGLVLGGTVRRLLLEVCEREGIAVKFEAPRLSERDEWVACFVSSTSRLLLPIDELYAPAEGAMSTSEDLLRTFDTGVGSVADEFVKLVQSEVESHSTAVKSVKKS